MIPFAMAAWLQPTCPAREAACFGFSRHGRGRARRSSSQRRFAPRGSGAARWGAATLAVIATSSATPQAARALFLFHVALFAWWAAGQLYYRVVARFFWRDPTLPFGVVSLALIVTCLVLTARFAAARRGTAAAGVLRLAVALAAVDVIGEALQFAPQLGLPALIPSDKSERELWVRGLWVSCEFGLRSATFVGLWRSQRGAPRHLPLLFAALVGAQWILALLSFAHATPAYAPHLDAAPLLLLFKLVPFLSFTWLALLIWLSHRVSRSPA